MVFASIDLNVYLVPGLVIGAMYALAASGLVLAYSTTGVLNLAYGAMAYSTALLFNHLRVGLGWSPWLALCVSVLVAAPLLGVLLWRLVFKGIADMGFTSTLIASIGVAIALPALCEIIFRPGQMFYSPGLSPNGSFIHKLGSIQLSGDQEYALGGAAAVAVGLSILLRFTTAGLKMRAVFDNRSLASLTGASPGAVSTATWALSSAIAGLTGILLTPIFGLTAGSFLDLTVASLAAALVGGLGSIGIASAAAMFIGVASSALAALDTSGGLFAQGIQPSFPFLVMALTLFVRRRRIDVGRAIKAPKEAPLMLQGVRASATSFMAPVAVILILPWLLNDFWVGVVSLAFVYAVMFLSFNVSLGDGGMLPLGQAAIAGISGLFAGAFAAHAGIPLFLAVLLGALCGGMCGAVLSMIGGRLGSVEFGFLTLAFGLVADNFIFQWNWLAPVDTNGQPFGNLKLLGINLSGARAQYFFLAIVLAVVLAGLRVYRRRVGFLLIRAGRASSHVAAATGYDPRTGRVIAFTIASLLAGLGGGLLGVYQGHLGAADVTTETGLVWLAVVVMMGVGTPVGALAAGVVIAVTPVLVSDWLPIGYAGVATILFGLGGLGLAAEPRGAVRQWEVALRRVGVAIDARRSSRRA